MKLYSTKSPEKLVELEEALFHSLPPDNGLYMPEEIPELPKHFFAEIDQLSFEEISFKVAKTLLGDSIEENALQEIIKDTLSFPAPIKKIEEKIYVLELFHGPSMAFKDFGARFMSRLMHYYLEKEKKEIEILVATSGDTGGAVALGFYKVPGIKVTILYPKGKVSPLQEKQLTTLGHNITALEVDGTFDDCQALVKAAFLDEELNKAKNLSSANSINIARLIPQMFYYFNAYAQLKKNNDDVKAVFSVPSGNFGNLTAGLLAKRMGLPVTHFVASTNVNDTVPNYLKTGEYRSKTSTQTLSNAMDVGNPSNFERMKDLFTGNHEKMKKEISGYSFSDQETENTIREVERDSGYILCPHTAIAYKGLKTYLSENNDKELTGIFLSSAHPCKFPNVYDEKLWSKVELPSHTVELMKREKQAISMSKDFDDFKTWLLNN